MTTEVKASTWVEKAKSQEKVEKMYRTKQTEAQTCKTILIW